MFDIYKRKYISGAYLQMKKKSIIKNEHGQTIKSLKKFKRGLKDSRKIDRINVIILAFQGKNRLEIAKILGFNNQTVGEYVKKYNEGGLDELLTIGKAPGRIPKITPDIQEELKEVILKTPSEIGYAVNVNWNSRIIAQYVKDVYNINIEASSIRRLMKRMGFTYTRPTYVLMKADEEEQKKFEEKFEDIKKH